MKRILIIVLGVLLLAALIFCVVEIADSEEAPETTKAIETTKTPDTTKVPDTTKTPETTKAPEGVSRPTWDDMLSAAKFENYTFSMEGAMTVLQNGENAGTSNVKETFKVTKDKLWVEMYGETVDSSASDQQTILFVGEAAAAQKLQCEQIFLALLAEYDNFTYDAASDSYKLHKTVTLDTTLKAFSFSQDGTIRETFDMPAVIEMREATVELSVDGSLVKFVCDYSQTMQYDIETVTETTGITTWTFGNYGTTVIE